MLVFQLTKSSLLYCDVVFVLLIDFPFFSYTVFLFMQTLINFLRFNPFPPPKVVVKKSAIFSNTALRHIPFIYSRNYIFTSSFVCPSAHLDLSSSTNWKITPFFTPSSPSLSLELYRISSSLLCIIYWRKLPIKFECEFSFRFFLCFFCCQKIRSNQIFF